MKKKNISSGNNIWDKEGFRMCGLGENCKIIAKIKYCRQCIRWSRQRVIRGFADCDRSNMYGYLQKLIPDMLQDLRDNRWGSSGYLGENYTNDEGILMNRISHFVGSSARTLYLRIFVSVWLVTGFVAQSPDQKVFNKKTQATDIYQICSTAVGSCFITGAHSK